MTPVGVAAAFLDAINSHDLDRIASLMTDNHRFVDSSGKPIQGRGDARETWENYFLICSDYRVDHEDLFADGRLVAMFGKAGGTIRGKKWEIPAAWKAVVRDQMIHEWRVYGDNKSGNDILI